MGPETSRSPTSEYVVVGSGAGGGTLAARLAEAGRTVVLLEAGGDPRALAGGDPTDPDGNRLPEAYDVPAFHAFARRTRPSRGASSSGTTRTTRASARTRSTGRPGAAGRSTASCTRGRRPWAAAPRTTR
jgi:choline dehydrogenase-like flavoprotein